MAGTGTTNSSFTPLGRADPESFLQTLTGFSGYHIALIVAAYYASVAFYRLYLHPLAKFPGPKLAAVTRLYEAWYDVVLDGQYTFRIEDMHRQYGTLDHGH